MDGTEGLSRRQIFEVIAGATLLGPAPVLASCADADGGGVVVDPTFGTWAFGGSLQMMAAHCALLPNGMVLGFGYRNVGSAESGDGHDHAFNEPYTSAQYWSPQKMEPVGEVMWFQGFNAFCSGHSFLGDGRLVIAGGYKSGNPFHPAPSKADELRLATVDGEGLRWENPGKMKRYRWYPTLVTLSNGDSLIIGGSAPLVANNWFDTNNHYEYYSVSENRLVPHDELEWEYPESEPPVDPDSTGRQENAEGRRLAGLYPLVHLLPSSGSGDDGLGILFVLTDSFVRLYNPATNRLLGSPLDAGGFRTWMTQGASVIAPIDIGPDGQLPPTVRIVVLGGGSTGKANPYDPALSDAVVYEYDVARRTLREKRRFNLQARRIMGDATLLPNGQVCLIGGAGIGYTNTHSEYRRRPELIDLNSYTSRQMAPLPENSPDRGYHATSLLVPGGQVFVTGGNGLWNEGELSNRNAQFEHKTVDVFHPPYLAQARPEIVAAPQSVRHGEKLEVRVRKGSAMSGGTAPSNATPPDVVPAIILTRNSSRTHSLDTDQRLLRLQARRQISADEVLLTGTIPPRSWAPPGPYLVWVLGRGGAPAQARPLLVHL
ncbi:MAG: DUF1929 domain-containing protein [Erythrobacter sp.]|nr:DUF1929 domain-containing protein [Erythrobacter sp.]